MTVLPFFVQRISNTNKLRKTKFTMDVLHLKANQGDTFEIKKKKSKGLNYMFICMPSFNALIMCPSIHCLCCYLPVISFFFITILVYICVFFIIYIQDCVLLSEMFLLFKRCIRMRCYYSQTKNLYKRDYTLVIDIFRHLI